MIKIGVATLEFKRGLEKLDQFLKAGKKDDDASLHVSAQNGLDLTMITSDMAMQVCVPTYPGEYNGPSFRLAANGRDLNRIVAAATAELITLEFEEPTSAPCTVTLSCGGASWTFPCRAVVQPSLPPFKTGAEGATPATIEFDCDGLSAALDCCLTAAVDPEFTLGEGGRSSGTDASNAAGVHFRPGVAEAVGEVKAHLVLRTFETKGLDRDFTLLLQQARALHDLSRLSGEQMVHVRMLNENELLFEVSTGWMWVSPPRVKWLDLDALLVQPTQKNQQELVSVDRKAFQNALQALAVIISKDSCTVRLRRRGDSLELSSEDPLGRTARVLLNVTWRIADLYEQHFNWFHLKSWLALCPAVLVMKEGQSQSGLTVIFANDALLHNYLLPVRLKEPVVGAGPEVPQAEPVNPPGEKDLSNSTGNSDEDAVAADQAEG